MDVDFTPFEFVPFGKEHGPSLVSLVRDCYAEYGQVIELETLDADLLCIEEAYPPPRCTFQVLLDGGALIGSVAVKGVNPNEAELKRVFLDRRFRGRGLGKKLSLWAFQWAERQGIKVMNIWSDVLYETAHHLYRRLGAEDTGRRRPLGGRNNVEEFLFVMRWSGD